MHASASSGRKRGRPTYSFGRRRVDRPRSASPRRRRPRVAALRATLPSCRSSERTPASRVQPATIAWNAASVIVELVVAQPGLLPLAREQVVLRRSRPSRPRCSRRAARSPCGRAAGRGSSRARSRSRGTARRTGRGRARGSGRGTCGSARGRAPRAARDAGSPRPAGCELVDLVDQHDGVHRPLRSAPGRCDRAARRRRYAGDRGSRPRRAHRRRRHARTGGRAHARPTHRATSCRHPEDRPARGSRRSRAARSLPRPRSRRSTRTARNSRMRSFTSSRPS